MAEPRARLRTKGQVFSTQDLSDLLYAFGDSTRTPSSPAPLASTVTTLDEILTDFIIETCHAAALSASYSRRQKIKVDDFKWVLRRDARLLGRVLEQLWRDKKMRDDRKMPGFDNLGGGMEGAGGGGGGLEELEGLAAAGGVRDADGGGGGRGRGRRGRKKMRRRQEEGKGGAG